MEPLRIVDVLDERADVGCGLGKGPVLFAVCKAFFRMWFSNAN
jgi:hypothetical protein